MNAHREEFPDFDAPDDCDHLLSLGYQDASWGAEPCPNFIQGRAAIFMDYLNPALREFPESDRFSVHKLDAEGAFSDHPGDVETFATLADAIRAAAAINKDA